MKKIMIGAIALAAVIGSVFAGDCGPVPSKPTAWVYKWKFIGKTTEAVKSFAKASSCGAATCNIRVPASLKVQGYTWACSPSCGTEGFETFAEENEVFWQTKPYKASIAGGLSTEVCNIIGKTAKKCEVAGVGKFDTFVGGSTYAASYTFMYAGLGKYSKKKGRISSASGNFAGYATAPVYVSNCSVLQAGVWECGTLALVCDAPKSVVYGKWSVKFKKSPSKKFAKNGVLPKLPSWAVAMNRE